MNTSRNNGSKTCASSTGTWYVLVSSVRSLTGFLGPCPSGGSEGASHHPRTYHASEGRTLSSSRRTPDDTKRACPSRRGKKAGAPCGSRRSQRVCERLTRTELSTQGSVWPAIRALGKKTHIRHLPAPGTATASEAHRRKNPVTAALFLGETI